MEIYGLMYAQLGPRHWWPAETKFEVVIGAILTQFVSWKNVTAAITNLKSRGLLCPDGICEVETGILEELIRCTRFYKQKAKKLKAFCCHVKYNFGGDLDSFLERELYTLRSDLLSLYGIGEETADSIILYAAQKPIFVVDAYTRRIFNRLGFFGENVSYKDMQEFFMDNLEHDTKLFNEYHALIVGVGNGFCFNKNPRCDKCPLCDVCGKRE